MNPMKVQARHRPAMRCHHAVRGTAALLLLLAGWSGRSQGPPVAAALVAGGGTAGRARAPQTQSPPRAPRPADTVTVSTCDESTLRAAIANASAGDTLQFGCSGTITLSAGNGPITITQSLTLDGNGNAVTISGGGAVGLFVVNGGVSFTVSRLTLANGKNNTGGAIDNEGGTVTVLGSTFSGNSAVYAGGIYDGDGGAISNNGGTISFNGGTVTVANSTFSGNSAARGGGSGDTGLGGAIFNEGGTVTVLNSTLSGNSADGHGGGIESILGGTTTLTNTILASSTNGNCDGSIQDGGGNVEDGNSCGFTATSSVSNSGSVLGPLANNGGPTLTMALYAGSPAVGRGVVATCTAAPVNGLDQRGVARGSTACDSGAFEGTPLPDPVVASCDETTLRAAIANAPAGSTLPFECSGTITLTAGTITIAYGLILDGHGQAVTISGGGAMGLFAVNAGVHFTVQGLTLANGSNLNGGAIDNEGGTVTVLGSTFSGNAAVSDGAINFNGDGGAIFNNGGTVTVANSTFSGNSATGVDNNGDTGLGGAIFNEGGTVTVLNSTVSGNNASNGGGIENIQGTTTLTNTILANSTNGNCDVLSGSIQDGGGNVEDGNSCGFTATSSLTNTNPLLAPLANNGGPTPTMGLYAGSPAIGRGLAAVCAAAPVNGLDQRGVARGANVCDSGAFEGSVGAAPTSTPTPTNTPMPQTVGVSTCDEGTLRAAIANAPAGSTLQFECSGTITLSAGTITINQNLTLDGHGQAVTIDGGNAVGLFAVNAGVQFTVQGLTLANGSTVRGLIGANGRNLNGGAIDNESGIVTVLNSTFSGNSAYGNDYYSLYNPDGNGGAIYSSGTLTVANSTFSGNSATGLPGNLDTGLGGAIYSSGTLRVINSTLSGNSASYGGGGIETWLGTTTLANTILASNTSGNCGGHIEYGWGNLEDGSSCDSTSGLFSLYNTNPLLAPLANNGGPTLTMALKAGSPAIGLGLAAFCAPPPVNGLDQRGVARGTNACDSGAVEGSVAGGLTSTPTPTGTPAAPTNTPAGSGTGTPVPPTSTSRPPSNTVVPTGTPVPPTSAPVPPTNTARPSTSASGPPATPVPTSAPPPAATAAPPTPTQQAGPSRPSTPAGCPTRRGKARLTLNAARKVRSGTALSAAASGAAQRAPVLLTLQVVRLSTVKVRVRVKVKTHGKTRTQIRTQTRTRRTVLYSVRATGRTTGCGLYQVRLRVTYRAQKAVAATLTLRVGTGKQAQKVAARVTIQPRT
jgi:hypothetical protein